MHLVLQVKKEPVESLSLCKPFVWVALEQHQGFWKLSVNEEHVHREEQESLFDQKGFIILPAARHPLNLHGKVHVLLACYVSGGSPSGRP